MWGRYVMIGLVIGPGCTSNRTPVFEPIADPVVRVGEVLRLEPRAIDRDGDPIRYGARGLPAGARFDRETDPPVLSWAPVASDADADGRLHPLTFIAQDPEGAATELGVVITVFPSHTTPTFTSPASYVLDLAATPRLDVLITLRDDDDLELGFELVAAPRGAALDPGAKEARLTWTPQTGQLARRRVFGFIVNVWDRPEDFVQQQITVVVEGPG